MVVNQRLFLALALPLLLGMRDPFQQPEDLCGVAQLSQWRYHGAIVIQERKIGLLRDAAGGWHRVLPQTQLSGGWQILQLTERELLVATGAGCEPAIWRWPWEGLKNETKAIFAGDSAAIAAVPGSKPPPGLAHGR